MEAYYSTSIANWKEKFQRKFGLKEWNIFRPWKSVAFFGLYNVVDYLKFVFHYGKKVVFWCGGDILNLQRRPFWQKILQHYPARHICENVVEYAALKKMGIVAGIRPCLVDEIKLLPITYKYSKNPHVYLCTHEGREEEYGVGIIEEIAPKLLDIHFEIYGISRPNSKNIIYHGNVEPSVFAQEINGYQCALRLNEFDGFSEILVHAMLRGQYAISRILYPYMTCVKDKETLIDALVELRSKTRPNTQGRKYWINELTRPL